MAQKKQNTPAQEGISSVGTNRKKALSTKTSKTARERAKSPRAEKTKAPGCTKTTSRTEKLKTAKAVTSKAPSTKKTASKKAKPSKTMALRKNTPRKVSSKKEMVTEALRSELKCSGRPHLVLVVQNDIPQNTQADVIDEVKNDKSENDAPKSETLKTSEKPETSTNSEADKPSVNPEKKTSATEEANTLYILGIRYSTGRDVEQNLVFAHKWFNLAAMMGHEGALDARAEMAAEMTAAQIAEAQKLARDWLWKRNDREEAKKTDSKVVRPLYVRRKAQAMRSTRAFARMAG